MSAKEKANLIPEESLLKELISSPKLSIGLPKEDSKVETRLALTPEGVEMIVEEGHSVYIERGAGESISFTDWQYSEVGAHIVDHREEVFSTDFVLKIAPPTIDDLQLMNNHSTLFSALQLSNLSSETIRLMMQKKMNVFAYDLIKDSQNNYPIINSIAEVEGNTAIAIISDLMSGERGGKGILLGGVAGITPTEIVILGASTAGIVAARAALALGAMVKVFDHDINKLRKVQHYLGSQIFTSVIHPKVLIKALASADAVIGNLRYINGSERFMISEDLIKTMKKAAVIVDLSIDQGGCFETSECRTISNPIYEKHGIIHYCVPNISARVGRTSSMALSNTLAPLILKIGSFGNINNSVTNDIGLRNGAYLYNGLMINHLIGNYYNIKSNNIGLFLSEY